MLAEQIADEERLTLTDDAKREEAKALQDIAVTLNGMYLALVVIMVCMIVMAFKK